MNQRLELMAGQLELRIKARRVSLFKGGNPPKLLSNWLIEDEFLIGSHNDESRAKINLQQDIMTSDMFYSSYLPSKKLRCTGLLFSKEDIERALPLERSTEIATSAGSKPRSPSSSGTKVRKDDWEKFAAAFAHLVAMDEIELEGSENAVHEKVVSFLVGKGHDNALSVDTVRPLIRRYRTWRAGYNFHDDTPLPGTDE